MELHELLNQRIVIDLNNIRLQRRAEEQTIHDDCHTSINWLMGGQSVYCKVGGRIRQKSLRVVA